RRWGRPWARSLWRARRSLLCARPTARHVSPNWPFQEQRRPVLINGRLDDPVQKIMFADGHWIHAQGSEAVVEEEDGTLYLGLALRNAGAGIAVLQGWHPWTEVVRSDVGHRPAEEFRRQIRDI